MEDVDGAGVDVLSVFAGDALSPPDFSEAAELLSEPPPPSDLPDGAVVTCIDYTTAVKGLEEIDLDTREGHLAYGVTGDHPLRMTLLGRWK